MYNPKMIVFELQSLMFSPQTRWQVKASSVTRMAYPQDA
jgi:hypothetical protein